MDHILLTQLKERLASGLQRRAITTCSAWAEHYRIMGQPYPGKWSFKHHPWTRLMHDCTEELVIGQKAAQLGYTEAALNRVFYNIDIKGVSCLYVLPSEKPDASNFSTSRFDPALELAPHLQTMFSDVKNIGHKRAGSANLFIRGSRSRSQLKSIPVGFIVFDEVDEMDQDNIPLAMERTSGQTSSQVMMISTPTIDNKGINKYFNNSTQDHFFFKCPHCSKMTELIYPDCLVITADTVIDPRLYDTKIICKECKQVLDHAAKSDFLASGQWVSTYSDREVRGFYINQLYSPTVEPRKLAESFIRAQTNPADEQEFYNSKLGLTHVVDGARITDKMLDNCIGLHTTVNSNTNGFITMGVDVGKWLNFVVYQWTRVGEGNDVNTIARAKLLKADKVGSFEELDGLMRAFRVSFCVIDANPERRKALEFAQRFFGHVRLCFYGNGVTGNTINVHKEEEHTVTVDRTTWLDMTLSRFKSGTVSLPKDISTEYKNHIKSLVRIYKKDTMGNPVGRYDKAESDDDHYAHASNYAEIALPLGVQIGRVLNIP